MPFCDALIYLLLIIGAAISFYAGKLTLAGAITGGITGLLIYQGAGITGIVMLALFFIAGTWATNWQKNKKPIIDGERHKGRRTAGQVIANGGVAAVLGAVNWYWPNQQRLMLLMMAGSLAAATADTLSSELGMVYGRKFYNVLTFKKDQRGLDGVISLEGTVIGLIGAILIGMIYSLGFGWGIVVFYISVAGAMGNLVDSILGATLERKQRIGNNVVNLLNTLTGALVCWLLAILLR